jgi:hypothetical protein
MRAVLLILLLLGGCSSWWPPASNTTVVCPQSPKAERPAEPPKLTAEAPSVAAEPTSSGPAAAVLNDYKAAAQKEIDLVTSPQATPEFVRRVIETDRLARRAVLALSREGKHPQAATLTAARSAVNRLGDVLAQSPGS